ncbi:unnamed protein product [Brachionus calyciflorus]|uniref:EGF-like domain-containing protein n=1 Tax=Brachionus calyciflorus TaxID=104777 RepID=A0A813M193_9BILA|nr:unnamed protein product [Brachionus calyciflorus]
MIFLVLVYSLRFCNGQLYATSTGEGFVHLWNKSSILRTLKNSSSTIKVLEYDSIKNYLYTGAENGIINIWDLNNNLLVKAWKENGKIKSIKKINSTLFSLITNNQLVLISELDNSKKQFEIANGHQFDTLNILENENKILIGSGNRKTLSIFCLLRENFVKNETNNIMFQINAVDLLDSNFIVTECERKTACILKILPNNSFMANKKISTEEQISDIKIIDEYNVLLKLDDKLKLWDLTTDKLIEIKNKDDNDYEVNIIEIKDENFFYIVYSDSKIDLWNIKTKKFEQNLNNSSSEIYAIKSLESYKRNDKIKIENTLATISSTISTSTETSTTTELSSTISTSTQTSTTTELSSTISTSTETSTTTELSSTISTSTYSFEDSVFEIDEKNTEQINELLILKVDLTDCLKNCSGNGKCKISKDLRFYCDCLGFYSGQSCHVDTRACASNPCRNNGTCINNLINKTYTCECFNHFFHGTNCELKKDVCENETCSNNGVCYDYHNEPKCKCNSLYNGTKCEILSDELKVIKSVIKTSSSIAIAILVLTYVTIAIIDLSNLFLKQSPKIKKAEKKTQNLSEIIIENIE